METKDWITIASVIALIVGWFVNGYLNRRAEIARKRLEYRLTMLKSFLKLWYWIQRNGKDKSISTEEYIELVTEIRENFQLYGLKDEITLFEEFVTYQFGKNFDQGKANNVLTKTVELVRKRIRGELKIG